MFRSVVELHRAARPAPNPELGEWVVLDKWPIKPDSRSRTFTPDGHWNLLPFQWSAAMGHFESIVDRDSDMLTGRCNNGPSVASGAASRWPIRQQRRWSGFVRSGEFHGRHGRCETFRVNPAVEFTMYEPTTGAPEPTGLNNTLSPQTLTFQDRRGEAITVYLTMFNTPTARWRALQTRDPAAATAFIYAVTTTRIYCRPTCPSRLARRANVIFFDTAAQAAHAGFRPCRRCGPADVQAPSTRGRHEGLVWAACAEMEARGGDVDLKTLARGVGLSARYFHGVFKEVVGVTPGVYAEGLRAAREVRTTVGELGGWEEGGLPTEEEIFRALEFLDGTPSELGLQSHDGRPLCF